jgi:hypothetical protein
MGDIAASCRGSWAGNVDIADSSALVNENKSNISCTNWGSIEKRLTLTLRIARYCWYKHKTPRFLCFILWLLVEERTVYSFHICHSALSIPENCHSRQWWEHNPEKVNNESFSLYFEKSKYWTVKQNEITWWCPFDQRQFFLLFFLNNAPKKVVKKSELRIV